MDCKPGAGLSAGGRGGGLDLMVGGREGCGNGVKSQELQIGRLGERANSK